uniref:Uncharacterized protein n=1 Tax=Vombatus ursinus TaxID=29139 RepID=A0A4X2LJ13_VOMUR
IPKRKVSSAGGEAREEPKRRSARLFTEPILAKIEPEFKKAAGKDKSEGQKVHTQGKKGTKGKQAELTNQEKKNEELFSRPQASRESKSPSF